MAEERPTTSSLVTDSVTDEAWQRCEGDDTSEHESITIDDRLLLLMLHNETLTNWTGSFGDPVFDYINIPLVKVCYQFCLHCYVFNKTKMHAR